METNTILTNLLSHAPEKQVPTLKVKEYYAGKNVMLTGCTGFLGKVILEKLLRSCPDINKFYIMIRPKRNKKPIDRVKNEILNSYNFSVLKRNDPYFMKMAEEKIIPI